MPKLKKMVVRACLWSCGCCNALQSSIQNSDTWVPCCIYIQRVCFNSLHLPISPHLYPFSHPALCSHYHPFYHRHPALHPHCPAFSPPAFHCPCHFALYPAPLPPFTLLTLLPPHHLLPFTGHEVDSAWPFHEAAAVSRSPQEIRTWLWEERLMWPAVTFSSARPGIPQEKQKSKVSWGQQFIGQQVWQSAGQKEAWASHHGFGTATAGADGTSRHSHAEAWHRGWLGLRWLGFAPWHWGGWYSTGLEAALLYSGAEKEAQGVAVMDLDCWRPSASTSAPTMPTPLPLSWRGTMQNNQKGRYGREGGRQRGRGTWSRCITLDESRLRDGRGQAGKDWDGSSSNSQIGYP